MVLLLPFDLLNGFVQLRDTDTEGAVFHLPSEAPVLRESVMHPFGGAAFDEAIERVEGRDSRRWTWSGMPPTSMAFIWFCRAMPPRKGQSLSRNSGGIMG